MTNKNIRLLILDVDGTLTDGKVYMGTTGEFMKAFDIKDGYGIANILPGLGITPVIITGRKSDILVNRCKELKITQIYQGVSDKVSKLREVMELFSVTGNQVAYMGDDLNDLECMKICGLTACPADAVEKVKSIVDFVSDKNGGAGAVRDFIDYLELISRPQMEEAFAFLEANRGKELNDGRIEIDGDRIYANVDSYETRSYDNTRFESHEKYIDIQYMISGTETIEVTERNRVVVSEIYDTNKDVTFYAGNCVGRYRTIKDGEFLIFRPEDVHRPCIATDSVRQNVKKMVIKVKIK